MIRSSIAFLFILLLIITSCNNKTDLEVNDLRCENLKNPLAIDKTVPRFSWKVLSTRNGTEQKAYQLLVASDISLLNEDKSDFWNSGKVESGSSIFISYQGENLNSGLSFCWKVRVWDEEGKVSPWSSPATFNIGLLNEKDWNASYIVYNTEEGSSNCPQFLKSFNVEGEGGKYLLHVNSLGYHEAFLNGQKVGNDVLSPAVSQFTKRSLINTYDVTKLLKEGKNELMFWLGSGWYTSGLPGVVNDGPVVKAQLEQIANNRRKIVVATDSTWRGRKSSYLRHGEWRANRFGGETVNGTMAKNDLLTEDTAASKWNPVSVIDVPLHKVTPQMVESNAITETIKPVAIIKLSKDTFLVDMGKNLTGWVDIHFPQLALDQQIKMEYCDHLKENGQFNDRNQFDRYIASGKLPEIFTNKFNYHGFRYIRLTGLDELPDIDSISAYLIHTNYDLASDFECSDPDLNEIHDMLFYTLRCLSLGGDLVDCPQIERLGYGGDGNASTQTAQTMFGLAPMYNNWLQAWADVIREDGGMPHTAPNPYPAGGGPYWCGFIISASWKTFLNYGDTLVLEKYYPVMQKWLEYVDNYSVDGLLKRWPDTDYRNWYLGDWATPEGIDQTAEASVDVVNNSYVAMCFDEMQKIATILGKKEDSRFYASKKEQLQKKIHEISFDVTNSSYGTGTQIDLAFPLLAGVVPENKVEDIRNALFYETEQNRNGHIACGLVGVPVLTEWAVENNAADFIYGMLKKRDYPGYLYMLDNGATTTWEHWDGKRSQIHNCYNGIGSWFYQAIGGIRNAKDVPAYQKVIINPQIPEGISWAQTSKETPFGKLAVNWALKNGRMEINLEIPVGIDAEVVIPAKVSKYNLDDVEHQIKQGESRQLKIKSGKYTVAYDI